MITLKLKRRDCFAISLAGKKVWVDLIYSEEDQRKMGRARMPKNMPKYTPIMYAWMVDKTLIWKCPNLTHLAMVIDFVLNSEYDGIGKPKMGSTDTGHRGAVLSYRVDYIVDLPDAIREALNRQVDIQIIEEYVHSARRFQIEIPERR